MANTVDKVIQIAMDEVGYLEKKNGDVNYLYDKTANAGDKNYTKYGYEMHQVYPQVMDYPAPWCDAFADWCFYKAYGIATAKNLLGGNFDDYTVASCNMYKKVNALDTNPTIGSQVFFTKNGQPSGCHHTGLVYDVDDTYFYTIEGNTSSKEGVIRNGGGVFKKKYNRVAYAGKVLFGHPAYDIEVKKDNKITSILSKQKLSTSTTLSYPCRGVDVSAYQTNIDYNMMKQSGVQFAILKITRKDLNKDQMFETHYKGFTNANIPIIGVYNYSYATTPEKAVQEANAVIKALEGRKIPVCLDIEDKCQQGIGKIIVDIINAYTKVIENAGLPVIIYTGMNFYKVYLKHYRQAINCDNWWIARYYKGNAKVDFNELPNEAYNPSRHANMGEQNIIGWQYSSKGQVAGYNGNLDINIMYTPVAIQSKVTYFDNTRNICTAPKQLRVRVKPSITSTGIDVINRDDVVKVYEVKNGFYRIGENRWCSGKYIQGQLIGYVNRRMDFRNSETAKGKIIGEALVGDKLELLARSHRTGWYLTPRGWITDKVLDIK